MLRVMCFLACAGLGAILSGCTPDTPAPRIWATDDMVQLTDRTPASAAGPSWEDKAATISLFSAANETVSFQLVVDAPPEGASEVRVAAGPLIARAQQAQVESIRLFRMLPVAMDRYPAWYLRLADTTVQPAGFYDSLVPIDTSPQGGSVDLPGGERLAVWVDVRVPRPALPGEYVGPISVRYRQRGGHGSASATVKLKVYDFVLPDARPVACVGGFSHETIYRKFVRRPGNSGRDEPFVPARLDSTNPQVRAGLVILRQLMRLGREHRVDLFDKTIRPLLKRDSLGRLALGWEDYDNIVKPYLDGTAFDDRIGVAVWPVPAWSGWPPPGDYGGADAEAYLQTVKDVLSQAAEHFKTLGMVERLFFWPRAGPSEQAAYERYVRLARLARSAAGDVPILTTLSPAPPPQANLTAPKGFPALADMFAPPADMFAPADLPAPARKRHPLAGLWLRPGQPPYLGSCGLLALPADVRALAWLAVKYRCGGILLPEVLHWDEQAMQAADPGQDRLFHPGAEGAILPSVRLKRLRRGLQDTAYLWLLRQRQRPAVAEAMIDTMVHYAALDAAGDHYLDPRLDGWVRNGALWVAARKLLAEEVLSAVHPENVTDRRALALRIMHERLRRRACRVRVERIGTRFALAGGGLFRATMVVELYNELVRPVEATLEVGAVPGGWRALTGAGRVLLPAGKPATMELSVEGDHVHTGLTGKMEVPLTLRTELHERRDLMARVPFLLASATSRPIRIDGDLSDWPLRPGNTAAAFKLLGRRGDVSAGLAGRQTAVFVVRDRENLYVAFRCDEPQPQNLRALPNNIIQYEQLMACGEDLVEMVFDPGRRGSSAEDLYHLVVKSNGVVVAERGVHTRPPGGGARPWSVKPTAAVGMQEGLWIVEMSIPLKAFGQGAGETLWGVNFMRFATAGGEASSWAGPPRYFYNPKDLGTMYLVPEAAPPRLETTQPAR